MKKRIFFVASVLIVALSTSVFAKSGYIFSVGHSLSAVNGEPAIDTSQEAKNAANNLANAGYSKKVVTSGINW